MVSNVSTQADRREYFRINDSVFVEFRSVNDDEAETLSQVLNDPLHSANSQEKSQFRTLQTAFAHLTDQISQHDREIARALRLLDEKINLINHAVQRQQNKSDDNQLVEANLSGGGIAFMASQQIDAKEAVEIKIELQPTGTYIHTVANVISCTKAEDAANPEAPYYMRLVFTYMSEVDRSLLIKHILNRQAEIIRYNSNQLGVSHL
ncbi:hypothetical protein A9Q92_04450 [Methylophaga sp. 42_8_T64]|nr:hypothetical protein A9Q78_08205 [Methylophaga sp. 41_12_T18]OUR87559.1 hypothetical protein A9Q92_04450 [Methylophaga sp. 42_8_T64]